MQIHVTYLKSNVTYLFYFPANYKQWYGNSSRWTSGQVGTYVGKLPDGITWMFGELATITFSYCRVLNFLKETCPLTPLWGRSPKLLILSNEPTLYFTENVDSIGINVATLIELHWTSTNLQNSKHSCVHQWNTRLTLIHTLGKDAKRVIKTTPKSADWHT